MINKVLKYQNVDIKKIVFGNCLTTKNKDFIVAKIWYRENLQTPPHTLHIQTPIMNINKIVNTDVLLNQHPQFEELMESIDNLTLNYVKQTNMIHKYNLTNPNYKTLINEYENTNIFKLKIFNKTKPTQFFVNKNEIDQELAKNILQHTNELKIIFELDGLVIDVKNNIIFTNIVARHVSLIELVPQKIELVEYSFIESDKEDIVDIILNSQIECFEPHNIYTTSEQIQELDSEPKQIQEPEQIQEQEDKDSIIITSEEIVIEKIKPKGKNSKKKK